jgi:hypothetical protein
VLVTTPEQTWAYAASVPVAVDRIPSGHSRGVVRVRATARDGRVGFGIPSRNGSVFVTEEYVARHQRARECVWNSALIVGNASSSAARSQVVVDALDLFSW